ncbi:hematinate-forming heme oxygenase ChuS, partial [Escherichia coli]|nr:hematinate-forming heme oxygenase ChuS [Escherichia coli]
QSIQFFHHQGDALLKVYATDTTDMAAWSELLARFIADENTPLELKAGDAPVVQMRADASVVEQEWRAMTDVHQFFTLLKRHNLTRQQAF